MQYSLNNVVVTGACGGLGTALSPAALSRGVRVALVGVDAKKLQTVARGPHGRQGLSALPARWHDALLWLRPRKPRPGEAGAIAIPGQPRQAAPVR